MIAENHVVASFYVANRVAAAVLGPFLVSNGQIGEHAGYGEIPFLRFRRCQAKRKGGRRVQGINHVDFRRLESRLKRIVEFHRYQDVCQRTSDLFIDIFTFFNCYTIQARVIGFVKRRALAIETVGRRANLILAGR